MTAGRESQNLSLKKKTRWKKNTYYQFSAWSDVSLHVSVLYLQGNEHPIVVGLVFVWCGTSFFFRCLGGGEGGMHAGRAGEEGELKKMCNETSQLFIFCLVFLAFSVYSCASVSVKNKEGGYIESLSSCRCLKKKKLIIQQNNKKKKIIFFKMGNQLFCVFSRIKLK